MVGNFEVCKAKNKIKNMLPFCQSNKLHIWIQIFVIINRMIHACLLNELNYCRINTNSFQSLICTQNFQIRNQDYVDCITLLIEESDRLQLTGDTKFTARKYFDIFLSSCSRIIQNDLIPLVVGCLRMAVKQCQSQSVADMYSLSYALQQCGGAVQPSFFLQTELTIMSLLNMKTKLVTPYSYLSIVKQLFPEKDITLEQLTCIIDFFLVQPQLAANTSEQLFFAALLYSFKQNSASPMSFQIVKALTHKWTQSVALANYLKQKVQQLTDM